MSHTYIIAEAGVNHNGDVKLAYELIDVAAESGADAVKFQTFKTENIVTRNATKAEYQKNTTAKSESQYDMLKSLELSFDDFIKLKKYSDKKGIAFLSTAFDHDSLFFLSDTIGLETLKVSSGEITNAPLLLSHGQTQKKIILSTGMSTLGEIEDALSVLAFGFLGWNEPSVSKFQEAYAVDKAHLLLKDRVTLLHCTTEYPAPFEDINLNAINTMKKAFGLEVGYSDHSEGITVPVAAVAIGASVIEKHFTLDKNLEGPDHKVSLEPDKLRAMVKGVREVEQVLGHGLKIPRKSELKNKNIAQKVLVAARNISKGGVYTEDNINVKRVFNDKDYGVSPMKYWDYIGKKSSNNYQIDELIFE